MTSAKDSPSATQIPELQDQAATHERMQLAVEVAGLGILSIDYAADTSTPDAVAAALFGLESGVDVPRSHVHDRFHPDDRDEIVRRMQQCLDPTSEGWFAMEHRVVLPDGSVNWLNVKKQIVFREVGGVRRPVSGLLAAVDITERKRIEPELQASKQRMQLAIEASQVGIWEWNVLTNRIRWDAQMFRIYGITPTPDGIMDYTDWSGALLPEDLAENEASLQDTVRRCGSSTRTFRIRRRNDGEYRHITATEIVRMSERGVAEWVVGTNLDVTERKQAEEAVKRSEEQFNQLANFIPQLAWMADDKGSLYWYNQRWYDYTGTTFDEMQGWGWEKVHDPIELQRMKKTWMKSLETGLGWEDTFPLRRHDGEYRWFLTRAFPIRDEAGAILRWFGTNTDITEQLETEQILRASEEALQDSLKQAEDAKEKALQASQRKDEFLANMSHELRTPLNAIVGIGHILAKTSPLSEKQAICVKTLQSSSESLLMLINDLLDLAKLESENIRLENIPFHLHELLEEIVAMLSVSANKKNLALMLDYDKRLEELYINDPHRLKQIVMNLASNAVKFTEQGSVKICVKLTNETRDLVNVAIHIIDTGIGIPEEKLNHIFSKFSQADTSISRKYGGTGLGLAISKTLAELMGGSIVVKSREGAGSEFTLHLPLAHDHSVLLQSGSVLLNGKCAKQQDKSNACQGAAPCILIVEDYKPNMLVATSYMEMLGFHYEVAQNGEEAVHKVQSQTYDLILMDVQMPGMDGLTATRAIRQWETTHNKKKTPIIGVTAYALMGDREKCLEAGMDDYISKPFIPEILQEKMESLMHHEAPQNSHEQLVSTTD